MESFRVDVDEGALLDLKQRLARTRWPDPEAVGDWSQGVPLERMQALVDHWRTDYDWRRLEERLNRFAQFRTIIDGVGIHFLHVRSPHENALPLLLTHGWPGSIVEFLDAIELLTEPERSGGSAADAFHLIVPSLPGYGFSDKPAEQGWGVERIALAWRELMRRLGYDRYVAQGGDWGSEVTQCLAALQPPELAGIHLNLIVHFPDDMSAPDAEEQAALAALQQHMRWDSAYSKQQSTRPQTLGYGLADSPVAQAAWIYEKLWSWTDSGGDPESVISRDAILDNITLYWLTNSGASSARLYWESFGVARERNKLDLPVGYSDFPREILRAPRKWAERIFGNIVYWSKQERGGHFAAWEQPALFADELRQCFRLMR